MNKLKSYYLRVVSHDLFRENPNTLIVILLVIFFVLIGTFKCSMSVAIAKHIHPEKYYQEQWCNEQGGEIEHVLSDGTRVDCLTDTHAIEFDFANKWAEAIGQSLHYAAMTGKIPGIVLIIESKKDSKYIIRLVNVIEYHNLPIEVVPLVVATI